eukprot:1158969-Pelagomonas_calceolata.AAC.3
MHATSACSQNGKAEGPSFMFTSTQANKPKHLVLLKQSRCFAGARTSSHRRPLQVPHTGTGTREGDT